MKNKTNNKVTIFGAGISGLVASICLAKSDFNVEVRDKREQVGGSPKWHPSVHQQNFDLAKTSEYIGIDLTKCFHPVSEHSFYFYGRKSKIISPQNSYVVIKGPHPLSIETYLFSIAKKLGVHFVFGEKLDVEAINTAKPGTQHYIIATGLELKTYRDLGIKHSIIQGFRSSRTCEKQESVYSFFGDYTNHDFAYIASFDDLMFSLLFARKGVDKNNLNTFNSHLMENEGLSFDGWKFSSGCVPIEKNLIKNGFVLAGTISGMIDPFYLNGISGALISGKIASQYFINKKKAYKDYNKFTKNFYIKKKLKKIADLLPAKKYSFPLIALLNNYIKWVGVV